MRFRFLVVCDVLRENDRNSYLLLLSQGMCTAFFSKCMYKMQDMMM